MGEKSQLVNLLIAKKFQITALFTSVLAVRYVAFRIHVDNNLTNDKDIEYN